MQVTDTNSYEMPAQNGDLPWFVRKVDEIFFQSLYDWNEMFKKVMTKKISQEEFRKYTLQERKGFSEQVIALCEKYMAQSTGYKEVAFRLTEDVVMLAEKKLKEMGAQGE